MTPLSIYYYNQPSATTLVLEAAGIAVCEAFEKLVKTCSSIFQKIQDNPSRLETERLQKTVLTAQEQENLQELLRKRPGNEEKIFTEFELAYFTGDQGGHGGNLKIACVHNSEKKHLFLKPLNSIELNNYEYIKRMPFCDQLQKYMIYTYGQVTIKGQSYLVMDNCLSKKNKSICDIKLAGGIKGLNPIASKDELKYHKWGKGIIDYLQMWVGSATAPDYMIAQGNQNLRLLNYRKSDNYLKRVLQGATQDQLQDLKHQLEDLQQAMRRSHVAFIGASVLINKRADGSFEILLIDLAHIQIDPNPVYTDFAKSVAKEVNQKKPVFSGTQKEFEKRIQSNQIAIQSIIDTVQKMIPKGYEADDESYILD